VGPADTHCLWEGDRATIEVVRTQASVPKLTETFAPVLLTDTGARVTPASES
jgi:hypothetical protein